MTVELTLHGITKEVFDQEAQKAFVDAVAAMLGVSNDLVIIVDIQEIGVDEHRRLEALSGGIRVKFIIIEGASTLPPSISPPSKNVTLENDNEAAKQSKLDKYAGALQSSAGVHEITTKLQHVVPLIGELSIEDFEVSTSPPASKSPTASSDDEGGGGNGFAIAVLVCGLLSLGVWGILKKKSSKAKKKVKHFNPAAVPAWQ